MDKSHGLDNLKRLMRLWHQILFVFPKVQNIVGCMTSRNAYRTMGNIDGGGGTSQTQNLPNFRGHRWEGNCQGGLSDDSEKDERGRALYMFRKNPRVKVGAPPVREPRPPILG